jgi:hypothetical protein
MQLKDHGIEMDLNDSKLDYDVVNEPSNLEANYNVVQTYIEPIL